MKSLQQSSVPFRGSSIIAASLFPRRVIGTTLFATDECAAAMCNGVIPDPLTTHEAFSDEGSFIRCSIKAHETSNIAQQCNGLDYAHTT